MISDHLAREKALQVDSSFIVQAPAGSGKTGLLVFRILKLLSTVSDPKNILAITFTRKATAEMRSRLLELLEMAERNESSKNEYEQYGISLAHQVLEQDRIRGWQLLDTPNQLQIMTIDAMCSKLAGSMPWLSRLGDRPKTTDNAETHYSHAVEALLSELLADDSDISVSLKWVMQELDFNYSRARALFKSMLAKRDQWLRHLISHDLAKLRGHIEFSWQSLINEQLGMVSSTISLQNLQALVGLGVDAAARIRSKEGSVSPLVGLENYDRSVRFLGIDQWRSIRYLLLTKPGAWRKTLNITVGFKSKTIEHQAMSQLIQELKEDGEDFRLALCALDDLPNAKFEDQDWEHLLHLEKVLKYLAAQLQIRFRACGECDHSEVTQRANMALQDLQDPTELGLRLDQQIQHILVDEFQDTSHGQIELLKRLTTGWESLGDQQNRSLFLVGDPMQSIYRFREADVSLFLRVTNNRESKVFPNIEIEPLALNQNFRSSGVLVDWFNVTFSQCFAQRSDPVVGAIRYAKAESNKRGADEPVVAKVATHRQQEVEIIVEQLQSAIANLPTPRDQVAILVRSRSQLSELLPAIEKKGINYAGVDIHPLKEVPAVVDVIALAKAITREDDRISWLAILRGPWCGLSLVEIQELVKDPTISIWQQLNSNLKQGKQFSRSAYQRISRFREVLTSALEQKQRIGLASLTKWAWYQLGGMDTLGDANEEDINTVFTLLGELQKGGDLPSVAELDHAFEGLYAKPKQENLNPQLVISTMHKSKGLQYHTVILPSLGSMPRSDDKEVMMWAEHQNAGGQSQLLLAPLRVKSSADDSHYNYLRALYKQRSTNESIRLIYVACTRAEQKLILTTTVNVDQETSEIRPPVKGSLLSTIWPACELLFNSADVNPDSEEVESNDELDQTLYRLADDYSPKQRESIAWEPLPQHSAQQPQATEVENELPYDWAGEVAAAVGTVLHDWLSVNSSRVLEMTLDDTDIAALRSSLLNAQVSPQRIEFALERLKRSINHIQEDSGSHFIFADYPEQNNEYSLSAIEDGKVKTYRIDRTFVDLKGVRWVVDYKSTDTQQADLESFADQQIRDRHRTQLEKYASLISQIDPRPICLAVYFPLLKQLRHWNYSIK